MGGAQLSPTSSAFTKRFAFFASAFPIFKIRYEKRGKEKNYLPCTGLSEDGLQGYRMPKEMHNSFFIALVLRKKSLAHFWKIEYAFDYISSI